MKEFTIGKNDAGQRLDRWLGKAVPLLPAPLAQKYIRLKRVKVNGRGSQRDVRLQTGDLLPLAAPRTEVANQGLRRLPPQPPFSRSITVRVIPGPQEDRFSQRGLDTFYHSAFTVTDKSDRMGCRLSGPKIEHSGDPNIISDGIPLGAVQVPSSGEPMIMMSEHQGSGGYTKIANVITVDIPLVAQCPPGAEIRFQAVTVEEAQRLYLARLSEYDRLEQMFRREQAGSYQVTVNGRTFQVEITAAW